MGQQGTLTRIWARRGTRPRAPCDTRYQWAYLFGAVCPARGIAAGLVLPVVNTEAMNAHLAEIARNVAPGAHALLILDGAGWHGSAALVVPDNLSLLTLPPYSPELNPIENVWAYLRVVSRMLWKVPGGAVKGHRFNGLREGFPAINLSHLDLTRGEQRPE